jgi:phosphoglycolate phosphatase-like HAD superfamily hydrolase
LSTKKSTSAKRAGRPTKKPPEGTVGWHIRKAREKAKIEPDEMATLVGLTNNKMISRGEHKSNFSLSVLILLSRELLTTFTDERLKPYLEVEDYLRKVFQVILKKSLTPFLDLAELLKELESLTPAARIKKLREWLEDMPETLQQIPASLGQLGNTESNQSSVQKIEHLPVKPRFEEMLEHHDKHEEQRQKRRKGGR